MPIIEFSNVKSLYIKNQNDEYKLINKDGTLVIEGSEYAPLNNYKIMYKNSLVVLMFLKKMNTVKCYLLSKKNKHKLIQLSIT